MLIHYIFLLLVLLALAGLGVFIWVKGRFSRDVGDKFVPNIMAFVETLGLWLTLYVAGSAVLISLLLIVFDAGPLTILLGLGEVQPTWPLVFAAILRGILILTATKAALYLLKARWEIWKLVQGVFGWIKKVSFEQSRVLVGFISIMLVAVGIFLVYTGVKAGPETPLAARLGALVSVKTVSGGNLPDALSGLTSQMKGGGINADEDEGYSRASGNEDEDEDEGAPAAASAGRGAGTKGSALYAGVLCFLVSLAGAAFLVVRKA